MVKASYSSRSVSHADRVLVVGVTVFLLLLWIDFDDDLIPSKLPQFAAGVFLFSFGIFLTFRVINY